MRVPVLLDPSLLRTAARCLLALTLCLNGFSTLPSLADSAVAATDSVVAGDMVPCHVGAADSVADASIEMGTQAGKQTRGKSDSSCCANGHCACGCIVPAILSVSLLPLMPHAVSRPLSTSGDADFPLARRSVLQRPPIA